MTLLLKDPNAVLDYSVDWGVSYLDGDAIADSSWTINPTENGGVEVVASQHDFNVATVQAAGGVPGHVYQLINQVVLASGRSDSRSIVLRVERR